ncbi:hypothetical protein J1614_004303 [Plenodomus biglobosus]|nr:hypothetical protein J1614_004303 [Plenodomus biglobosus]
MEGDASEVAMPSSSYLSTEDLAEMEIKDEETPCRQPTLEMEVEDNAGNIGLITKMKTSFAHPIKFNVAAEDVSECNFCEMPMFGIIGHFEREVYVIRWYNGRGYTEIGHGHCEDNGPTKMCGPCACIRLQIMVRPNHEIEQAIDSTDMPDLDELSGDLISAEPGSEEMFYQLQRWCSMCFAVAKFGCATVQPSVCGEEETNEIGCGLRLCERCAVRLQDEFGGDVGLMASHMDTLPKIGVADEGGNLEGRARADVGFLKRDGLLMTNITAEE